MGVGIIVDHEHKKIGPIDCSMLLTCDQCAREVCPGCELYVCVIRADGTFVCPQCIPSEERFEKVYFPDDWFDILQPTNRDELT